MKNGSKPIKAYRVLCETLSDEHTIVLSESSGKARYKCWFSARDAGWTDLEFKDFKVKRSPEYDNICLKENHCYGDDFCIEQLKKIVKNHEEYRI